MGDTLSTNPNVALHNRRLIILTEGRTDPLHAKTATSVVRYRPEQVVALLDTTQDGKTAQQQLGVGGEIPIVARLDQAPNANTLMLGIAPAGGKIPAEWRGVILEAISRRMDVLSGLHDFLCDDAEFADSAARSGSKLIDVRKNDEHDIAQHTGMRKDCLRVLTVGQDCSAGKMVVAIELSRALQRAGYSTKFVATGQTGIMIEGDGSPIDCVVADFVSGAVEKQVLANQHHDILMIEGQGSLAHPRYSGVSLSLLHGSQPSAMILCYEVGRTSVHGMEDIPLISLAKLRELYEAMASLMVPSQVIGIAMNSRKTTAPQAELEREKVRAELGLPVCDVFRHGTEELLQAICRMKPKATTS